MISDDIEVWMAAEFVSHRVRENRSTKSLKNGLCSTQIPEDSFKKARIGMNPHFYIMCWRAIVVLQVVFNYWTSKLQDLPENEEMVSADQIAFALLKWLEELLGCDASEDGVDGVFSGRESLLCSSAHDLSTGSSSNHPVMVTNSSFSNWRWLPTKNQATTVELPATLLGNCRSIAPQRCARMRACRMRAWRMSQSKNGSHRFGGR